MFDFIDNGRSQYRGVLIISETNQTRSIVVVAIYLMMKYKWTLMKTLEFLNQKKVDAVITSEILGVLKDVEA